MAFDVSALADYTEQNEAMLVTSSVMNAKTQLLIASKGTIMTGIKSAETINVIDTDAQFQSAANCGWNPLGTTTITQRVVTVGKVKINEAFCPKVLEAKYTQKALAIGSKYESIPFEQEYTTKKTERIAAQNEVALWQGDTGSGNGNLNKFDGLIKLINAASATVVHANTAGFISGGPIFVSGAPITGDQALNIVDGVFMAVPAQIIDKDDFVILCGWDFWKKYIIGLKNKNWYNYSADNDATGEVDIPGTPYKLIAVHGLDGTNRVYGLRLSNLYLGTDMENEEDKWEMFYAKEADEVRFRAEWKLGINFAFPDEIVEFHPL